MRAHVTAELLKGIEPLFQREFDPRITLGQLNRLHMATWGAKNHANFMNKGFMFDVNGHHLKGKVLITLAWDDTYNVTLIKEIRIDRKKAYEIGETFKNVYCDELSNLIDKKVEYIEDYTH